MSCGIYEQDICLQMEWQVNFKDALTWLCYVNFGLYIVCYLCEGMIPMCRLWLHGLYGLYGPPMSAVPKWQLNSLAHSTPLHSTPLLSTPLHSTPLHSTPLHSLTHPPTHPLTHSLVSNHHPTPTPTSRNKLWLLISKFT